MKQFISYSAKDSVYNIEQDYVENTSIQIPGLQFFTSKGVTYYTVGPQSTEQIKSRISDIYGVDLGRYIDGDNFLRNGKGEESTLTNVGISEGDNSITINFNHFFYSEEYNKLMSDLTKEKLQAYLEGHNMSYYNFINSMLKLFDSEEEVVRNIHSIEVTVNSQGVSSINLMVNVGTK